MESVGIVSSVFSIVQLILHIHDVINVSDGSAGDQQVARSLETSHQKLQIWQKTWLDSNIDTTKTSTALWGTQGLTEIQKSLQTISKSVQEIEIAVKERNKFKTQPSCFNSDKTQAIRDESVKSKQQSRWKRALQKILERRTPIVSAKQLTMLKHATELSSLIDELWTYSEVVFNSLHSVLVKRAIDPPAETSVGDLLANALGTRVASIALYRACSKTTRNCSLEVDLFGAENQLRVGGTASSRYSSSLFYHLSTQPSDTSEIRDMTIESVLNPDTPVVENNKVVEYENPDLTVFAMRPASETGIVIRAKTARTRSYFRVAKLPANVTLMSKTQNLAQVLYKWKLSSTTGSAQTLPFSTRIELAFKLVECALYLLGTPWLASLNSKRLRRMNVKDGRRPYVLEVQTLDLEELSFEDPEALTERSQLFHIGVLLVEIALGSPEHSAPTEVRGLDLRTSKMLTLVQQSMGPQYCKATAFCLRDRESTSRFGLPEKYQYPEKTGWKAYLLELLEDYHAQVFLRLEELREKVEGRSDVESISLE